MSDDRNRAAMARAKGRRQCAFEVTEELYALIGRVRDRLEADDGRCTRVQAIERMCREGAKRILREGK